MLTRIKKATQIRNVIEQRVLREFTEFFFSFRQTKVVSFYVAQLSAIDSEVVGVLKESFVNDAQYAFRADSHSTFFVCFNLNCSF